MITEITVYKKNTGEIVTGYIDQSGIDQKKIKVYVKKDEDYIEGFYTNKTHEIVDGKPTIKNLEKSFDLNEIRIVRNALLEKSDWTQIQDSPLPEQLKKAWQEYRKKLRDLPSDYKEAKSFKEVIFPEQPK